MKRVPLSGDHKTIQALWDWYQCQSKLSLGKKSQVLIEMRNDQLPSDPLFFGMTGDDVEEFFGELDYLIMFDLLAAAEAAIRVDFLNRVNDRKKDDVSRQFRDIHREKGRKVALKEDILGVWKEFLPTARKGAVGDFNGALKLRDWLAHGRYWTRKLGRDYSPDDVYDIAYNLLDAVAT